ncbi:hypothetical protein GCM10027168_02130 [Streptomyces capparidis]
MGDLVAVPEHRGSAGRTHEQSAQSSARFVLARTSIPTQRHRQNTHCNDAAKELSGTSQRNAKIERKGCRDGSQTKTPEKYPDMRRPPPGGRAGVVPTADSGGEESGRVSTVANDP